MTFVELREWVAAAERGLGPCRDQLLALLDAVAYAQRADDRCVLDFDPVYAAAGLEPPDRRVGDKFAMLKNCIRFVDQACEGGGPWASYAELESQLAEARERVRALEEAARDRHLEDRG